MRGAVVALPDTYSWRGSSIKNRTTSYKALKVCYVLTQNCLPTPDTLCWEQKLTYLEMVLNVRFTYVYGGEYLNCLNDSFSKRVLFYVRVLVHVRATSALKDFGRFLGNVNSYVPDYTASLLRTLQCEQCYWLEQMDSETLKGNWKDERTRFRTRTGPQYPTISKSLTFL